jgi:predicted ATPase
MSFISSISIDTNKAHPFPFNIPAVQFAKDIQLGERVTILAGDNGTGKSTLLETIAAVIQLPLIGGINYTKQNGFEAALILKPFLRLNWKRKITNGFFFRAEDFSDFINGVEQAKNKIAMDLMDLHGEVPGHIIDQMSEGMNYQLREMRKIYGDDMQAYSHGEAYLKILQTRIRSKGIYILDEPEAALSPVKQLSLIGFILDTIKKEQSQFIIATHSPILMGIPGATIYEIREQEMEQVSYENTEHYLVTKNFLLYPEIYLRHL